MKPVVKAKSGVKQIICGKKSLEVIIPFLLTWLTYTQLSSNYKVSQYLAMHASAS